MRDRAGSSACKIDRLDMDETVRRCEELIEAGRPVAARRGQRAKLVLLRDDPRLRGDRRGLRARQRRRPVGRLGVAAARRPSPHPRRRHRPHVPAVRPRGAPRLSRLRPRGEGGRARDGARAAPRAPPAARRRGRPQRLLRRRGERGRLRGIRDARAAHPLRRHDVAAQGVLARRPCARSSASRSSMGVGGSIDVLAGRPARARLGCSGSASSGSTASCRSRAGSGRATCGRTRASSTSSAGARRPPDGAGRAGRSPATHVALPRARRGRRRRRRVSLRAGARAARRGAARRRALALPHARRDGAQGLVQGLLAPPRLAPRLPGDDRVRDRDAARARRAQRRRQPTPSARGSWATGRSRSRTPTAASWRARCGRRRAARSSSTPGWSSTASSTSTSGSDGAYLDAAVRAGDFLADVEATDGTWPAAKEYSGCRTRTTLASTGRSSGSRRRPGTSATATPPSRTSTGCSPCSARTAGSTDCVFKPGMLPSTHGLAYTMRGLLESAALLGERRYLAAAAPHRARPRRRLRAARQAAGHVRPQDWTPPRPLPVPHRHARRSAASGYGSTSSPARSGCSSSAGARSPRRRRSSSAAAGADVDGALPGSFPAVGPLCATPVPELGDEVPRRLARPRRGVRARLDPERQCVSGEADDAAVTRRHPRAQRRAHARPGARVARASEPAPGRRSSSSTTPRRTRPRRSRRELGARVVPAPTGRLRRRRAERRAGTLRRATVVVFLDADAIPAPGWGAGLARALAGASRTRSSAARARSPAHDLGLGRAPRVRDALPPAR